MSAEAYKQNGLGAIHFPSPLLGRSDTASEVSEFEPHLEKIPQIKKESVVRVIDEFRNEVPTLNVIYEDTSKLDAGKVLLIAAFKAGVDFLTDTPPKK